MRKYHLLFTVTWTFFHSCLPFCCQYTLGWTVRSEQENVLHQNLACSYENYGGSSV